MIKKNEEYYKLNEKLSSVDSSGLSMLGSTNESALGILSSRVSNVLNGTSDDNWSDSVRGQINQAISSIGGLIEKAKRSSQFITEAAEPVNNLKTICAEYVEQYNDYVEWANKTNIDQYKKNADNEYVLNSSGNRILSDEYINWQNTLDAFEISLPKLESEVARILEAVKNYFAAVNFETNTIDSNIYVAGASDITFDFKNYFNGVKKVTKEEYVEKHSETKIDKETGNVVTVKEYELHKEYSDGAKLDADGESTLEVVDENNNGQLDENEQFTEKIHETGTLTTKDDKELDYERNKESDNRGLVHEDVTLTDQETEQAVYQMNEDREAAYDGITGEKTLETNKVEETENELTETRTVTKTYDDEAYQSDTIVTRKQSDKECGKVVTDDGRKTEVYRDENGNLRAKEKYTDKNGNEQEYSDHEIPLETKTFTIKYPDGRVESMDVNPNNPIDQQLMRNKMEDARSKYYVDSYGTGLNFNELLNDGSSSISDVLSDSQYTFTLR